MKNTHLAIGLSLVLAACHGSSRGGSSPVALQGPSHEVVTETALSAEGPAAQAQCPAVTTTFDLDGHELRLPGPILFETGAATILEQDSSAALWYLVDYLAAKSYVSTLRIEGHHSDSSSQALTEQRALAVGRWLIAQGVACDRLLAVGFGDSKPVASNQSPEGRAQNVRILGVNAALRGRAIGGMPIDGGGRVAGDLCN